MPNCAGDEKSCESTALLLAGGGGSSGGGRRPLFATPVCQGWPDPENFVKIRRCSARLHCHSSLHYRHLVISDNQSDCKVGKHGPQWCSGLVLLANFLASGHWTRFELFLPDKERMNITEIPTLSTQY